MWRASRRSLVPSWLADPLWSSVRARARKTTDPALARLPRCYIRACAERCEFGSATRWLSTVGKDGQSRRTNHWSGRVDSNHRPPGPELSKRRVMIGDDCFRSETQTSAGKGINVEMRPAFPQPSNCIATLPGRLFRPVASQSTSQSRVVEDLPPPFPRQHTPHARSCTRWKGG
jgi:hypothetical protein